MNWSPNKSISELIVLERVGKYIWIRDTLSIHSPKVELPNHALM